MFREDAYVTSLLLESSCLSCASCATLQMRLIRIDHNHCAADLVPTIEVLQSKKSAGSVKYFYSHSLLKFQAKELCNRLHSSESRSQSKT